MLAAIVGLVASAGGCTSELDTNRVTGARGSIGREMFTMICDRVGAQALREDVAGASYHALCHADAQGTFADKVDVAALPPLVDAVDPEGKPVTLEQQASNREHRIARIEAVARRRRDLILAFDTSLSHENIGVKDLGNADETKSCAPPGPDAPSGEADLRVELGEMLGRLTDLYNDDTIPHFTRALARLMDDIDHTPSAHEALARFDARRGYRPKDVGMGVARPTVSYPRLVELANALLRVMSSDIDPLAMTAPADAPKKKAADRTAADRIPGKAHGALVDLLGVIKEELRTSKPLPVLPLLSTAKDPTDPTLVRLSRPRGNLEMARSVLLAQDPAFSIGEPHLVVARDPRGFAKVPLLNGKVPAPFLDRTGPGMLPDGLPDVDALGQFATIAGDAPSPFADFAAVGAPLDSTTKRDARGRAVIGTTPVYDYIDVSSTFLASLTRDLVPLLEPDPKREHETVMDLLGGLTVVAGRRQDGKDSVRSYGGQQLAYRGFREDQAPLLDLMHAVGQVLADPSMDDTLALVQRLAQDKPQVLARLIGAGLRDREIASKHPEAALPAQSTFWDELLDVVAKISSDNNPKLVEDVIRAFGDDRTLDLAKAGATYMEMRDQLTYDRNNLNGTPFNVTTNKVQTLLTRVDRSKPDSGANRSVFQRFIQTLHDANGLSICTKPGAVAHIKWRGVSMDFPSGEAKAACFFLGADTPKDPMPACGLIRIENVAHDIVDAVLGQVKLDIRDDCMKTLVDSPLTGVVGGADAFLEDVSGITGFTTKPSVPGISRLVFFDLPHDGLAGDTQNAKTRNFLRDLFDPVQTLVCPAAPFTDKDGRVLNLRNCGSFKDTMRGRDLDALFPLEQMNFLEAAKPLAKAFADSKANLLFVDLFDTLHNHWGSAKQSADECSKGAPRTNARWCSQDGAVTYEPLVAEMLRTDLFPAMHDGVKELAAIKIPHCDARDAKGACTKTTEYDGVKVLAEAVRALVNPAKHKGLKQRNGDVSVVRNDGTKNAQVTPIYLLIDAFKGFDRRFDEHKAKTPGDDRAPAWRRARSQIVDELFAVDAAGPGSKLKNAGVAKVLPTLVSSLRSQIAANCPDPAKSCTWAREDLPNKARDLVIGPTFATTLDVLDAIRSDEPARTELERFLVYLFQSAQADASNATLGALVDVLQVFEDDASITALLNAASEMAAPEVLDKEGRVASRGLLLSAIEMTSRILGHVHRPDGTRICAKEIDPNRTLAVVLRRMTAVPPDGRPPALEVLIDVAADVNRRRPQDRSKLQPDDYASIAHEVSDFCANPSRGLEQVYAVVKQATKDL